MQVSQSSITSTMAAKGEQLDGRYFTDWMKLAEKDPGGTPIDYGAGLWRIAEGDCYGWLLACPRCDGFSYSLEWHGYAEFLRKKLGGRRLSPDRHGARGFYKDNVIIWARARGWRYGQRRAQIACPECISKEALEKRVMMANQVVSIQSAVAGRDQEAATKRRALIAKVNEELLALYPIREKGYVSGGSDEIIAKKTGASVAFVAEERERGFGPANVIDLRAVEIKVANMERVLKECEDKAMAALQLADSQVKAARALVADLKSRL